MKRSSPPTGHDQFSPDSIVLRGTHLRSRTFLLGNAAGFVLYLPVEQNTRDSTLVPIKWFGASEFGRKYFETSHVAVTVDGATAYLDRRTQTGFVQELERAVRTFQALGHTFHQTFFVPSRRRGFVMTIEGDVDAEITVWPEFDMRYYQAFNREFTGYRAEIGGGESPCLKVMNRIPGPTEAVPYLDFFACICSARAPIDVQLQEERDRLHRRTYLKDEMREKLIQSAYAETQAKSPDEAPIWDTYSTCLYEPARISGSCPLTLVYGFADRQGQAEKEAEGVRLRLPTLRREKAKDTRLRLRQGLWQSGNPEVDRAYAQVLTRFNDALIARDAAIHAGGRDIPHFSAIFAGNKYFLDAWKRDENISLIGLLVTDDYETVRAILDETWQYQDERTGRLPHIIRLGEPLVYYSSDGTLWALRRLHQYTRMSGDTSLLDRKYEMVSRFFRASLTFVQRGLLPSGGIINKSYLWETWEDTPYTPRDGYPVEIELLWLTALADYLPVIRERDEKLAARLESVLDEGRETFTLFHLDGYLADSLSYAWQPRKILTPNGYIAFGLDYPLPPALAHQMVELARKQLAGRVGVRSLAPRDWGSTLSPQFLGDPHNIHGMNMASVGIYNYHRGIEWLWLNPFFVDAELRYGDTDQAYRDYVQGQVQASLHEAGVGGLSELHDLRGSLGADFQAWSMAGFINSLHAFAGVSADALARKVRIRPSIPAVWPYLVCRSRVGKTRFDLRYDRSERVQKITVRALDEVTAGRSLELGIRVPPAQQVGRVSVNGSPILRESWRRVPGCAAGVHDELWIETAFARQVEAEFESA